MDYLGIGRIEWGGVQQYAASLLTAIVLTTLVMVLIKVGVRQFFKHTHFLDEKKEQTIESVLANTLKYTGFTIVMFMAVKPFVPIKELLMAGGVLGIVIGFGAQSAIKDFLYGFFFLFEGQFKKGDFVHLNGDPDGGTVEELGFRALKIRQMSGKVLTISNGEIRQVVNGNVERRRVFESVVASYRESPERVKNVLEDVCRELNERQNGQLKRDERGDFEEAYRVFGLSSLDASIDGYRYSIAATVEDTAYIQAVQEAKEVMAQKLYDEKIRLAERHVFYRTQAASK